MAPVGSSAAPSACVRKVRAHHCRALLSSRIAEEEFPRAPGTGESPGVAIAQGLALLFPAITQEESCLRR